MSKKIAVAAKAMIVKNEKFLTICKLCNKQTSQNKIDIPGGRLEFGETLEKCLEREVKEETGLQIKIIKPLSTFTSIEDSIHLIGINYLCKYIKGKVKLSSEHVRYRWISLKRSETMLPSWLKDIIKIVRSEGYVK